MQVSRAGWGRWRWWKRAQRDRSTQDELLRELSQIAWEEQWRRKIISWWQHPLDSPKVINSAGGTRISRAVFKSAGASECRKCAVACRSTNNAWDIVGGDQPKGRASGHRPTREGGARIGGTRFKQNVSWQIGIGQKRCRTGSYKFAEKRVVWSLHGDLSSYRNG